MQRSVSLGHCLYPGVWKNRKHPNGSCLWHKGNHGSVFFAKHKFVPCHKIIYDGNISYCCVFSQETDLLYLSVNLQAESVFLKDRLNLHWDCEFGIVDNILQVVEEYKQTRQLLVSFDNSLRWKLMSSVIRYIRNTILSFVLFLKILAFSIFFYNLKRFLNNVLLQNMLT